MPTLLDPPATAAGNSTHLSQAAAERLRSLMAAVRLSFIWFGVRKTLTQEQKSQAADAFGAEGEYLSAAKKLLDTSHPAYRAVTGVKSRIVSYWRGISLPCSRPTPARLQPTRSRRARRSSVASGSPGSATCTSTSSGWATTGRCSARPPISSRWRPRRARSSREPRRSDGRAGGGIE